MSKSRRFGLRDVFLPSGAALLVGLMALPSRAQDVRGAITGQVKDAAGGVMTGVAVTATRLATNQASSTRSNEEGRYDIPYLIPGTYKLTAEREGFKTLVRSGIEVRVGDRLVLDLVLEPGGVTETVDVSGGAPLLNGGSAALGQVLDSRRISELPVSDHNPFVLARLAPGVSYTGDYKFSRAFDNGGTSSIVTNGASGGNEFTLDGAPNMCNDRRVAFVPPADAVAEFKVETASFDAQQGHTGGAVVNVVMKSGTNELRGMLQYMNRDDALAANDFFLNRQKKPKGKQSYNVIDALLSGPIRKDKTFFMVMFEGLKDEFPEPLTLTVPTLAERSGDFSALLPSVVIYDPKTAAAVGNSIVRQPFPNNQIPLDRLHPMAKDLLKYMPEPNATGNALGVNNYLTENPRKDTFHSETVRLDHQYSPTHRGMLRYSYNYRREDRNLYFGETGGLATTGNYLFRINHAVSYDHVWSLSSSSILDVRANFSRFVEKNQRPSEGRVTPSDLGFSAATSSLLGDQAYVPQFDLQTMADVGYFGGGAGQTPGRGSRLSFNIASIQPTLSKIVGRHSVRLGLDLRSYRENVYQYFHSAGLYVFDNTFTRQTNAASSTLVGQDFAAFLLGIPSPSSYLDQNASRANESVYTGLFVQDDFRVSSKLTLNVGLRYDYESPVTERYDRNLRGFDTTSASPIASQAQAAYAQNPIPEIPAGSFAVRGGPLFASDSARGFWDGDKNNIQPRLGFVFQQDAKTLIRGGAGLYSIPNLISGVSQAGFSQQTNVVPTNDSGLNFRASISDPFPDRLTAPSGSSQGLATFIGNGLEFFPLELKNGRVFRWQIGVQRELAGQTLVEASYVGNYSDNLTVVDDSLNAVPAEYLSTLPERDTVTIGHLDQRFPNPFLGLATKGTGLNTLTEVTRRDLLRPYPQFPAGGTTTGLRTRNSKGTATYHALQLRFEKRFSHGFTLNAAYTYSKSKEKVSYLNPTDTQREERLSASDTPHRLSVSGIFELPFGKGRKWGSRWTGLGNGILGGWQVGIVYMIQSGTPLDLSGRDYYYQGDFTTLKTEIGGATVNDTFPVDGFYPADANPASRTSDKRINLADHVRTFPTRIDGMRGQTQNLCDISLIKNVRFKEKLALQLRAEAINAFNHAQFNTPNLNPTSPDFGKITGQFNLPRSIQMGVKLLFN